MFEIDIHTHQVRNEDSIGILNIFAQDLPYLNDKSCYSAGLHPWHIGQVNLEECLESIELATSQRNMLAVGECGIDRSVSDDFAMQELYFRKQIEIAQKHSKPLIIHCVRAFPELIKIKKETKSDIPWIIHGFHGNQQTALQLMKHNFYFSVGKKLLSDQRKKDILKLLPADRLFLETDIGNTSISEIYSLAAQTLNMSHESLIAIVLENFKHLFGFEKLPILI